MADGTFVRITVQSTFDPCTFHSKWTNRHPAGIIRERHTGESLHRRRDPGSTLVSKYKWVIKMKSIKKVSIRIYRKISEFSISIVTRSSYNNDMPVVIGTYGIYYL